MFINGNKIEQMKEHAQQYKTKRTFKQRLQFCIVAPQYSKSPKFW